MICVLFLLLKGHMLEKQCLPRVPLSFQNLGSLASDSEMANSGTWTLAQVDGQS